MNWLATYGYRGVLPDNSSSSVLARGTGGRYVHSDPGRA